jgi:hypothetical protein
MKLADDRLVLGGVRGSADRRAEGNQNAHRTGPCRTDLPSAHTCFNTPVPPDYRSKESLRDKLLIALQNAAGFGEE